MSCLGPLAARLARRRLATMLRHAHAPRVPQQQVLTRILAAGATTAFGREHGLAKVRDLADLQAALPLQDYASMAPWWERARAGERHVTWPGLVRFWAISSGTTSGEKYLPVSAATIAANRRGGFDALVPHLAHGDGDLFGGKLLFLGGSTTLRRQGEVCIGDNTGIMALHVPRCLRGMHVPDAHIRGMASWEDKVAAAARQAAAVDLRMLAGVPSWIVLFGEAVLAHCRATGREVTTLAQVWPNLQLFVHGGVTFAPYADRVRELVGRPIRCTDTYSASEGGMLAVQDRDDATGMLPLLDRAAVFEFVPATEIGSAQPRRLLAHEVEPDVDYAVALTTDSGLYSYLLGDLVRFPSVWPLRLQFAGRIAHTLNSFGEHVSGGELERGIAAAAAATSAIVTEFAVATRYPAAGEPMGGHQWFVEFQRPPADLSTFAQRLDATLQSGNEDYATHRTYGLLAPLVAALPGGTFLEFMRRLGKVGGQHKVPRVLDERKQRLLREVGAS